MSLFRRILIICLAGFVVGAVAGVGYILWQKQKTKPALPSLVLSCSGGSTPAVLITWPPALDADAPGLQRSTDQGEWKNVAGTESVKSGQGHFLDLTVQSNVQYRYRISRAGVPVSTVVQITTSTAACRGQ